jgi:hypothetical protein
MFQEILISLDHWITMFRRENSTFFFLQPLAILWKYAVLLSSWSSQFSLDLWCQKLSSLSRISSNFCWIWALLLMSTERDLASYCYYLHRGWLKCTEQGVSNKLGEIVTWTCRYRLCWWGGLHPSAALTRKQVLREGRGGPTHGTWTATRHVMNRLIATVGWTEDFFISKSVI